MDKKLCLVHANCQGPPLIERLMACPEFADTYECSMFTNYIREPIPEELFGRCSLFLYQHLKENWGDFASETLLAKLPADTPHLCIPNLFFTGYWPIWNGKPGFDYRCGHLESHIDMGLSPEETVMLFLRSNPASSYDLLALVSQTIELERNREAHTPIKYLDVIIKNYRTIRLFNTVNHPGPLLTNHVAKNVLAHLGFQPPETAVFDALGDPFPEFEQPINPKIAEFFGWDFAGPDTQYAIYGRKMTYARYAANYVMARHAGISDFIGYLQGAHNGI